MDRAIAHSVSCEERMAPASCHWVLPLIEPLLLLGARCGRSRRAAWCRRGCRVHTESQSDAGWSESAPPARGGIRAGQERRFEFLMRDLFMFSFIYLSSTSFPSRRLASQYHPLVGVAHLSTRLAPPRPGCARLARVRMTPTHTRHPHPSALSPILHP